MSDEQLLRIGLAIWPEQKFRVYVLADELQHQEAITRFQALRKACKVRREAINLNEIASALECVEDGSPWRDTLLTLVIGESDNPRATISLLTVVAGSRPPSAIAQYKSNPGAFWYEWHFTVGARWILRAVEELEFEIRYDKANEKDALNNW